MSSSSKKILIFSLLYLPEYVGGAEIAVDQITKQKELEGYEFHMITLGGFTQESRKVGSITVHYTGLLGKGFVLFTISKFLFILTCVWKYLSLQKKHVFDAIWPIMASYAGLAAFLVKVLKPKQKLLLTIQEGDTIRHIMKRAWLSWPMYKGLFVKADSIQVISKFLEQFSLDILNKQKDEKIVVIPNGVDVDIFSKKITDDQRKHIRKEYGFVDADIVIVTTSRLTKKNGVDTLIETLKLLPEEYKLMIIGAGEDEFTLKKLVEHEKLFSRVIFVGRKKYEELYAYLGSSDVFARLSRSEGFGNSFIEAMVTGLPVVGTSVGGIVDFLQDGVTGYIAEPDNPESAKQAILRASLKDKSVIEAGVKTVQDRYTWSNVAKQFDNLFKKIL